jgi:cell fate (sporulation/competence/biofilm development) regulator YlbF (YheA/YmcA/DUF963 family)
MFSKSEFFCNSKILNTDSNKHWIPTPIWLLTKEPRLPGKVVLENGDNPSIYSLWEIKTEGLKANACEISTGAVVRLKNMATDHFLSFGSQLSFLQHSQARLMKHGSKETTEIISEEIKKDDSAVLNQGFSKLGRFCLKIQSRQEHESKSLVKEDLITLSLLKRQKFQLGIFASKPKRSQNKTSKAFSKSFYGSGEFQSKSFIGLPEWAESNPSPLDSETIFNDSKKLNTNDNFTLKFSEFCSSRQNHFKVQESGMDFSTERLASSFLSAVFEFYSHVQDFGFDVRKDKLYFELKDVINQNAEFDNQIEMFSQSLRELQRFLSKDEKDFCKQNFVI